MLSAIRPTKQTCQKIIFLLKEPLWLCVYVYVPAYVSISQKRVLDPLELELQETVTDMDVGNPSLILSSGRTVHTPDYSAVSPA